MTPGTVRICGLATNALTRRIERWPISGVEVSKKGMSLVEKRFILLLGPTELWAVWDCQVDEPASYGGWVLIGCDRQTAEIALFALERHHGNRRTKAATRATRPIEHHRARDDRHSVAHTCQSLVNWRLRRARGGFERRPKWCSLNRNKSPITASSSENVNHISNQINWS